MIKYFTFICLFICSFTSLAQKRTFEYDASMSGFIATKNNLPFWAISNQYGLLPDGNGGLMTAGIFSDFNEKHQIQFAYGVSVAGYLSKPDNNVLIDQLYFSTRWKKLRLDLGMIHRDTEFNGISSTNGNIVYSNNARSMPGYNLRSEFINIPFTKNILAFKFNLGDYMMIDDRYVDKTRVHNKSLYVKITPHKGLEFIAGLEHFVQWSGTSPDYGKQPSSFKDYIRVFFAKSGGDNATTSDAENALGNHLTGKHFRINYLSDDYTITLYNSTLMEDNKPWRFPNFPDGIYGIYFGSNNKNRWISDIIYEFVYTKYQSGRFHDRDATEEEKKQQNEGDYYYGKIVLGGNDEYFNNGEYKSGWTLYGRTIGTPLITPNAPNENGIVLGVYNNRVLGHHIGIKGVAFGKVPYKAMLTYTLNYGRYNFPLADNTSQAQYSFGLEAEIPEIKRIPLRFDIGIYGDTGKLLSNNFGVTLKISKKGVIR
ncbi:capsule assembly Wzi family protein [Porphyromonadaceae bacterium OttesenSCG-928-L07]|nr:capsule assembly Wzi family protein [Porphyromonadaceae bacterium OttesenSCG-928-L07]MDL2251271.1 capsule assembly Wzi family protein [Odoribacter sp. OttesenSCG-928-J03]